MHIHGSATQSQHIHPQLHNYSYDEDVFQNLNATNDTDSLKTLIKIVKTDGIDVSLIFSMYSMSSMESEIPNLYFSLTDTSIEFLIIL